MGPPSWSGDVFATEPFPEQAYRAVPDLSRYAYQGSVSLVPAYLSVTCDRRPAAGRRQYHQEISVKSMCLDGLASAQFADERPATYRPSILSHETNENREQKNRKLMRKHTEQAPVPSGHAV